MTEFTDPHATAAAALAAIDLAPFRARLEAIAEDQERMDQATAKGEDRTRELTFQLVQAKAGPDRSSAADAMLRGVDVMEAAPAQSALEQERAAINAGLSELRARRNSSHIAKDQVLTDVRRQVAAALAPAVDEHCAGIESAMAMFAQHFAALKAIAEVSGETVASNRTGALAKILDSEPAQALLGGRSYISVPEEVVTMLEAGSQAIAMWRGRIPTEVSFPRS